MKDFFQFLKLPPTLLTVISIVTGSILFLPETILAKMGLDKIGNPYNIIIGIMFLLSVALVFMYIIKSAYKKIKDYRFKKRFPALFEKIMNELSEEEKAVIYVIYQESDKTLPLPITSGITLRLTSKMIIQRTTNIALTGPELEMPYMLTPATLKFLYNHPNFLKDIPSLMQRFDY